MLSRLLLILCLFAQGVHADESTTPPDFTLNGFGTAGLTRSSNPNVGFVRDLSQEHGSHGDWRSETDSLFGLQANWNLTNKLSFVAQGITRYHGSNSYNPELMWAFARYEPNDFASIRLGRLGTDFYLYSDSRNVGYSYLTVRPSADYFGLLPFSHIDGGDVQLSYPLATTIFRARMYLGWLNETFPLADRHWSLKGSRMAGGSLSVQQGAWTIRLSSSELYFKRNLPIEGVTEGLKQASAYYPEAENTASALEVAHSRSRFHSVGGVYDDGPLQLQLMLSRVEHSSAAFQNWQAGYALAGYRLGAFTPFVGYSWIRSQARSNDSGIPDGVSAQLDQLNAATRMVFADSHSHQNTTSLGIRWDFMANMDLKVQYDLIRGKPTSTFPYRDETNTWNGKTNILSVVLDFVF